MTNQVTKKATKATMKPLSAVVSQFTCWRARRAAPGKSPRIWRIGLLMVAVLFCLAVPVVSQAQDAPRERKLVTRVEPEYPATLARLYIGGVVRVSVVVGPNGSVQSVSLLGGNPILGQAAMTAIKQWKYAPASAATTVTERLEFDPHR